MSRTALESAVRETLGEGRILPGDGRFGAPGPLIVTPRSTEEAAAILARASQEGWGVALGGARGVPGIPGGVDLLVLTSQITGIVEYEPADLTLTAMAGIRGRDLLSRTAASGQWLPLDPPGWPGATLGGMLANGESGTVAQAYGRPRDLTLGLTLVTGDGRVLEVGGRVVKNVAGFDLVRLAVGSRGALGLITRASVRLFPRPERDVGILIRANDVEDLMPLARAVITSPLPLAGAELRSSWGGDEPGPGLLVRVMGDADPVEAMIGELRGHGIPASAEVLEGESLAPVLEALSGEDREVGQDSLWVTATALPDRLPAVMAVMAQTRRGVSTPVGGVIQASCFSGTTRGWFQSEGSAGEVAAALDEARSAMEALGGGLAIRRAPAEVLERVSPLGDPGPLGDIMRGLREVFDPAGILRSSPFFPGM